jgi:hypothetical protein
MTVGELLGRILIGWIAVFLVWLGIQWRRYCLIRDCAEQVRWNDEMAQMLKLHQLEQDARSKQSKRMD